MPNDIEMPAGGAEAGESIWAAAEKMATAHEAQLTAEGKPIPGGGVGSSEPLGVEADDAEPVKAKAPEAKAKPVAGASADLTELEKLAAKHGMKLNGNRIEPAERIKFRDEKRQFNEWKQREQAALASRSQEESSKLQPLAAKYEAFAKAFDAQDVDGMARAAGFKDYRDMQNEQTKRMASPEYKRIRELEERQAAIEERDKRVAVEQEQRAQHEKTQAGIRSYKEGMVESLKGEGGQLERMAGDSGLVDLLYDVSAAHYRATGEELELQDLIETPTQYLGGKSPLDWLKDKWENLNAIFGDHPTDLDEASKEVARRSGSSSRSRERKPPKTVSQRNAAEASGPTDFKSEKEFMSHFTNLLNQSTHISGD